MKLKPDTRIEWSDNSQEWYAVVLSVDEENNVLKVRCVSPLSHWDEDWDLNIVYVGLNQRFYKMSEATKFQITLLTPNGGLHDHDDSGFHVWELEEQIKRQHEPGFHILVSPVGSQIPEIKFNKEPMACLECERPMGRHHAPACGKRVIGCPAVVSCDCKEPE